MFRKLWLNFAYNTINNLVDSKLPDLDEHIKKFINSVLDGLKKLVAVLTDSDTNDKTQALAIWQEKRSELAGEGIDYAIEIIDEKIQDETLRTIAKDAAETLKQTLLEAIKNK